MDINNFKRLKEILDIYDDPEKMTEVIITEMFNIHNLVLPTEYSKSCLKCRKRVFESIKNYYDDNKNRFGY